MIHKSARLATLIAVTSLLVAQHAGAIDADYATDVSHLTNPSPGTIPSNINNYLYQDEQLNLNAESGVVSVLRTDQKSLIRKYVTKFIHLQNASPRELRSLARIICRKEGGDADTLWDKKRNQNGLVVVCPPFQLPYIEKTLAALDHEWVNEIDDGSWTEYYQGTHRDIHKIYNNIIWLYTTPDRDFAYDDSNNAMIILDQPCIKPLVDRGFNEVDIPPSQITLEVEIFEVDTQNDLALGFDWESWKNGPGRNLFELVFWDFYGDEQQDIFPGALPLDGSDWGRYRGYNVTLTTAYLDFLRSTGRGRLVTRNTLAVKSGEVAELAAIDDIVAFEAKATAAASQLSLDPPSKDLADLYEHTHRAGQVRVSLDTLINSQHATPATPPAAVVATLVAFVRNLDGSTQAITDQVAAQLALRIADGELTKAEVGTIPVPLQAMLSIYRDRSIAYAKSQKAGVLLTMAPVVGLESAEIAMSLDLSEVVGQTPAGGPIIDHQYFSSAFTIANGQPIILGGLTKTSRVKARSGMPYLSRIPYLGLLFGREVTTKRDREVVVIIKPQFQVYSMKRDDAPETIQAAIQMADGGEYPDVPWTGFGFDQVGLDQLTN